MFLGIFACMRFMLFCPVLWTLACTVNCFAANNTVLALIPGIIRVAAKIENGNNDNTQGDVDDNSEEENQDEDEKLNGAKKEEIVMINDKGDNKTDDSDMANARYDENEDSEEAEIQVSNVQEKEDAPKPDFAMLNALAIRIQQDRARAGLLGREVVPNKK
jgi:hypothetical protein